MARLFSRFISPLQVSPYALERTYDRLTGETRRSGGEPVRVQGSDGRLYHVSRTFARHNNATDIAVASGARVRAVGSGTVVTANQNSFDACGRYARIEHARGWRSLYCHLSQLDVAVGDRVSQGQFIGATGASGNVTGPHLHFVLTQGGERQPAMRAGLHPGYLGAIGTNKVALGLAILALTAMAVAGAGYAVQSGRLKRAVKKWT